MKWSPSQDEGELKGGTLVRDIWTQGMDSIHDMRTMNTDATSYLSKNTRCAWKMLISRRK